MVLILNNYLTRNVHWFQLQMLMLNFKNNSRTRREILKNKIIIIIINHRKYYGIIKM